MEANIVIAFPRPEDARNVKNILVKSGMRVSAVVCSGASALAAADVLGTGIMICSYKLPDMPYFEVCECMPEGFRMLLIASGDKLAECGYDNVVKLSMPFMVSDLVGTVDMMRAAAQRRGRGRIKGAKVRTGEDTEILKAAKDILIERNGFTEAEAHKYIQKCSMDSGTDLIESARMVFSMFAAPDGA